MLAVVVPAHNEEQHIGACLAALRRAARCPELVDEEVALFVVLDACTDRTGEIAKAYGVTTLVSQFRNVGAARALGGDVALAQGARWLAFTDADTEVAPNWLSSQLALCSDAVCGTIAVRDWSEHGLDGGAAMERHFRNTYTDADGHTHIHGANLGVSAQAYTTAGGFKPLATSEDVALVAALRESGASIAWSCKPRVFTSARRSFRAPGGFGATLVRIGDECSAL